MNRELLVPPPGPLVDRGAAATFQSWMTVLNSFALARLEGLFSVFEYGLQGSGTTADPWVLPADFNENYIIFPRPGRYRLSANWSLASNARIWAVPGVSLDANSFTFQAAGATTATSTTITADASKSTRALAVSSISGFAVDDWVEIKAAEDEYSTVEFAPRELNRITAASGTTLTMKWPLVRTYDYDAAYATQASVAKVTPVTNIEIIGLGGYVPLFSLAYDCNLHYDLVANGTGAIADGRIQMTGCRNVDLSVREVIKPIAPGSGVAAYLLGCVDVRFDVKTAGSNEALRIYASAGCYGSLTANENEGRDLWFKFSEDCTVSPCLIRSTQASSSNIESVLFEGSVNCWVNDLSSDRPGLTGSSSLVENLSARGICGVRGGKLQCYSTNPTTSKVECQGTVLEDIEFHIRSASVTHMMDWNGSSVRENATIHCRRWHIINHVAADITLFRASTATQLATRDFTEVMFEDIVFPRNGGNLISDIGSGAVHTYGIARLVLRNIRVTENDGGNGTHINLTSACIPIRKAIFDNVRIMDNVSNRAFQIGAVEEVYFSGVVGGYLNGLTDLWSRVKQMVGCKFAGFAAVAGNGWQVATLDAAWTVLSASYPAPTFMSEGDVAYIGGSSLTKSSAIAAGDLVLTLPAGMRPDNIINFVGSEYNAANIATFEIATNGQVTVDQVVGAPTQVSFPTVCFSKAAA